MVRTNLQEFVGDVHVLSNLQVGSNLFANDLAANVLTVDGSIGSTFFIGDGGLLSNIATTLNDIVANPGGNTVSNTLVFESGADVTSNTAIATLSNVGISISNTEPTGEFQFAVGSNIFVNTHASNVLTVVGAIGSDLFIGDGGLLSNIATTIDQIIDQGNTVSNTLIFESGIDATSNTGIVTKKDVGISVSNTEPTGEFQFGVGSNLLVNVYSSNVLAIEGNVSAEKMTLGTITVTSAYGLNHVTAQGSVTGDTISLTNATTGLAVTSNATVGGNVTAETVITSANVEVGDRLKFASNVFVDDLRVADLAANLVTYDKTTGELMDSGGLFANKLAVVSVQPPSALSANVTTVAKHGTYTVTTSSLATYSNAWNAFDGDSAVEWLGSTTSDHVYNGGGYTYSGTSNLFAGNYIQPGVSSAGEWLAIEFPYKTTLRHMKLTPPTTYQQYPASANVYATNDSLTWTELTNWSGVNPVTSSNVQTVVVNATESFKKYAMVVTKTNGSDTNTALAEWKLFTESFSIDGGQISMAQQPVTGGETTMEQSGPHSRLPKAMPLKKYPEIIFEEGKFDSNDSTNTYVQAGYTVTASSQQNDNKNAAKLYEDNFPVTGQTNTWQTLNNTYDSNNGDATSDYALGGRDGSYTTLELPHKIKLSYIQIQTRNSDNFVAPIHPKQIYLYGSNDGSSWTQVGSHLFTSIPISPVWQKIDINSTTPYNYFALQVTSVLENESRVSICQLRYYGYEELATQGDTSVDTTFTSIMNTPQTTGAQVYVDGSLGETFTNRVTGPTPTGTATSYDQTGKYWELTGALESNVTLEANTFLEGDQPHAVSVWFNSSNLEANVSNTCVFSVSDQEKLDSVNLDLQSNTWHNLTYAYQGEGGSRVTYLDGRKVAEDQAEDTFGDYPPFAMTGYSQGGYVVSSNFENSTEERKSYNAFNSTGTGNRWQVDAGYSTTGDFLAIAINGVLPSITDTDGTAHVGHWLKLELPHRLRLNRFKTTNFIHPQYQLKSYVILGSNDDVNWTLLHSEADANLVGGASGGTHDTGISGVTESFKYLKLLVKSKANGSSDTLMVQQVIYYGHRENDLVRLPDPTNVLKYPHIAMTGLAQRGYVVTGSTYSHVPASGDPDTPWRSFDGITGDNTKVWKTYEMYTTAGVYSPGTYGRTASSITDTSSTQHSGEYLVLETPHKIKLSSWEVRAEYAPRRIVDYAILGSDTNSSSANKTGWTLLTSGTFAAQTDVTATVSSPTTAFKYHAIVVKSVTNNADSRRSQVHEMKLYGTGVDSIPIQIGGGNIDKVANFRVYDTFVGEDQALEIWDAQKDLFREVKNSMTLQKGRLGIGTTEPEGRLAVADEPHNLEEFPPRAMTGYETYIEGHGVFRASASSEQNTTTTLGWHVFAKIRDDINKRWRSNSNLYDNTVNPATTTSANATFDGIGVRGEWILLEMPYNICLKKYEFIGFTSQTPHTGQIWGSDDSGTTWHHVDTFQNAVGSAPDTYPTPTNTFHVLGNTRYYSKYVFIVEKVASADDAVSMSALKFFGTREQGQSVLHDGQLTLTKSLTVPRIGPALDADDTPRRDRLVVEYNTSTNPTFEGVVRDTSGRGNDGVFYGGASYDATEKALVFDGASGATSSVIEVGEITNYNTNWVHSVSVWLNMHSPANYETVYSFGDPAAAARNNIAIHIANTQFLAESTGGSSTNYWNITGGAWKVGIWEHFVFVRDGSLAGVEGFKIYQNGVELASTGGTNASTAIIIPRTSTFRIGQRITSVNDQPYDGDLSQFKLYDTALTAEEVKTLYDMGRCDEGHHVVNFSKTRVGIGLGDGEAPRGALDVRGETPFIGPGLVIAQAASGNWGTEGDPANMNGLLLTLEGETGLTGSSYWNIATQATGNSSLLFAHRGKATAYIQSGNSNNPLDFTGQHRTFIKDVPFSQAGDLEGLIVSSDQNKYIKISGGIETGSNAIMINESLPVVSLSTTTNDKKCFGVISASEDPEERSDAFGSFVTPFEKEKGDTRVYINSVGEGAIWVVNTNGSLESGDYITTSNVAGYGQKQDDDILHNYTVAKITMDCDFNPATQPIQQILRSNVIQTYYLGNVHHTKTVPHEFVTTTVGADDAWSNVSVSPSDVTYAEWSNLEANTQNTYTLTYTQTSNVVYDTKYTLTTTANVTESDPWDSVFIDPPSVTYAEYSNLEANTQNTYTLTFTQTTTDEKTPAVWSNLESNTQSLYNMVYYQSVEEEVASDYPGATTHTRVTDVIENELDAHGQIQWEDHATETEKAYKIRYLDVSGAQTDSANAVHIAAFVGCTYHCG